MLVGEIAKLFPNLFGQPSAMLVPSDCVLPSDQKLKIGVVLSGGQAPGGHNVISGIFGADRFDLLGSLVLWTFIIGINDLSFFSADYLQNHVKGSTLYGFRGGPAGIMKCKYVELDSEFIYPYRNQVSLALVKFVVSNP